MQADAEQTTAEKVSAAELAHAAVFTADGHVDDDGVEHVTQAGRSMRDAYIPSPAMQKAQAAAATYNKGAYAEARFAADMDALTTHKICVRSAALGRLIGEAIELKKIEKERADAHTRAQVIECEIKRNGGSDAEIAAGAAAEVEAERVYIAARENMEAAAYEAAHAPFADIGDLLARTDAYARLVGTGKDNEPENTEDCITMRDSYRAALEEMHERTKIDDDAFDVGESRLRSAEGKLTYLSRQWDEKWGSLVIVPEDADPELRSQIDEAYAEREAARTLMYAGTPRDVGQLLSLMEIAFDHIGGVDVGAYEVRARNLGTDPVEERDMWKDNNDAHRRALALIATHAARLRDQSLPRDWQDLMASMSLIPNARDALWRAYDEGMDVQRLKTIQLRGHHADQLPILVFDQPDGTYWIRPDVAFKGEAMQ